MAIDIKYLQHMEAAGVGFTVHIRIPGGGRTLFLNTEEVFQYLADKDGFAARQFGLTKQEYAEWVETDGFVRCAGTTTSGTRCKNHVSGGSHYEPEKWKRMQGQYCTVHGGPASQEA